MTLVFIQHLIEMSARNLSVGKARPALRAYNLKAICKRIVQKMRDPGHLVTLLASTVCYRDGFIILYCS
jgi:hypothetical protein